MMFSALLVLFLMQGAVVKPPFVVPHAVVLFGVNPNPKQRVVFLCASDTVAEGDEIQSGQPVLVDFGKDSSQPFKGLESFDIDASSVWSNDGREIWIEEGSGIYKISIDAAVKRPELVISAKTRGLALSDSRTKLAFWKLGDLSDELTVFDTRTRTTLKSWKLARQYGSEPYGFQIEFGSEDLLYARTYDVPYQTPLKAFNLRTGAVKVIERDCWGLASISRLIYFIADVRGRHVLKTVSNSGVLELGDVGKYDELHATADAHVMALEYLAKGRSAFWDISKRQIIEESNCSSITSLLDRTVIYIEKGVMSSDRSICK